MTGPHLITTTANPAICPRCHHLVLVGLAEGETARVDPVELDQAAEVIALLSGRTTYTFTPAAELVRRDASRITGGLNGVILAQHECTRAEPVNPPY